LLPIANPDYVFSCMDEAFEVLFRITLRVREWSTYAEFAAYDGTAPTTLPNVVGTSPGDCTEVAAGMLCNDKYDWDDFIMNQTTGAFGTYTQDLTPANWAQYYPRLK